MKLLFNNIAKHYRLSLIVLTVIIITTILGCWQILRAYEKASIQEKYIEKSTGESVQLDQLLDPANKQVSTMDVNYQHVESKGHFIRNKHILLDNQILNGRVGFNVITPFVTEQGRTLLVDRGWIGPVTRRDQLPNIIEYTQQIKLSGLLFDQVSKPFLLAKELPSREWPKVVQSLDIVQLKEIFNLSNFYLLRLNTPQIGAFTPHFKPINVMPEKHWGYAVQWFAMAVVISILFLRFIYKNEN